MITFSQLGNYGRLGNQLFQYALLKSVSLKNGYEIALPSNLHNRFWHGQKNKLDLFLLPSSVKKNIQVKQKFNEPFSSNRDFIESVYDMPDDTDYFGFFQNINYYKNIREELLNEFQMIPKYEDFGDEYLSKFKNTTVSLHVRRGDVSDGTNRNAGWSNEYTDNSILKKYHTQALSIIPEDSTILLFTGGSRKTSNYDSDLNWCKENIKDKRILYVNDVDDIETFSIIKKVDYCITSFNSTFSWWASYLNENENIICPHNFTVNDSVSDEDIYPENWKIL